MARGHLPAAALIAVFGIGSAVLRPEYGYGGTCVPGYDEGCVATTTKNPVGPTVEPEKKPTTTENDDIFEPTSVGPGDIFEPTSASPGDIFEPTSVVPGVSTSAAPEKPGVSTSQHCAISIPRECVFPFRYKGMLFNTCTGVDAMQNPKVLWCSTDRYWKGHWRQCTDPCKNKVPVHAIVSGVVASGVAATGIGLIAAAVANKKKNGELGNPFENMFKPREGSPFGLKEPPVPQSTSVQFLGTSVYQTAVLRTPSPDGTQPGVMLESYDLIGRRLLQRAADTLAMFWSGFGSNGPSVAAPSRQLQTPTVVQVPVMVMVPPAGGTTAKTSTTTIGNAEASGRLVWVSIFVGICVICCACCCAIAAAFYGGYGKKRSRGGAVAPRDDFGDQPGYPQQYDQVEEGGY